MPNETKSIEGLIDELAQIRFDFMCALAELTDGSRPSEAEVDSLMSKARSSVIYDGYADTASLSVFEDAIEQEENKLQAIIEHIANGDYKSILSLKDIDAFWHGTDFVNDARFERYSEGSFKAINETSPYKDLVTGFMDEVGNKEGWDFQKKIDGFSKSHVMKLANFAYTSADVLGHLENGGFDDAGREITKFIIDEITDGSAAEWVAGLVIGRVIGPVLVGAGFTTGFIGTVVFGAAAAAATSVLASRIEELIAGARDDVSFAEIFNSRKAYLLDGIFDGRIFTDELGDLFNDSVALFTNKAAPTNADQVLDGMAEAVFGRSLVNEVVSRIEARDPLVQLGLTSGEIEYSDVVRRFVPDIEPRNAEYTGTDGNDVIGYGADNNVYFDGQGDDIVGGGGGFDTFHARLEIDASGNQIGINVEESTVTRTLEGGETESDRFGKFEGLSATGADDEIDVSGIETDMPGGGMTLRSFEGDDSIVATDGNDIIEGGAGDDRLVGGDGEDVFLVGDGHGSDEIYGGDRTGRDRGIDTINAQRVTDDIIAEIGSRGMRLSEGVEATVQGIEALMTGSGSDKVEIEHLGFALGHIDTGGGDDAITIDELAGTNNIHIDGGADEDSLTFAEWSADMSGVLTGEDGENRIEITSGTLPDRKEVAFTGLETVDFSGSRGDLSLAVTSLAAAQGLVGSEGHSRLDASDWTSPPADTQGEGAPEPIDMTFDGTVLAGARGEDTASVHSITLADFDEIVTGAGNDHVVLDEAVTSLDLGRGYDTLDLSGRTDGGIIMRTTFLNSEILAAAPVADGLLSTTWNAVERPGESASLDGVDALIGTGLDDYINAVKFGGGLDYQATGGRDTVKTGKGDDTIALADAGGSVSSAGGDDTIRLNGGNVDVDAGFGRDTVDAESGRGMLDGGRDHDTLSLKRATEGVEIVQANGLLDGDDDFTAKSRSDGTGEESAIDLEIDRFETIEGSGRGDVYAFSKTKTDFDGGDGTDVLRHVGHKDLHVALSSNEAGDTAVDVDNGATLEALRWSFQADRMEVFEGSGARETFTVATLGSDFELRAGGGDDTLDLASNGAGVSLSFGVGEDQRKTGLAQFAAEGFEPSAVLSFAGIDTVKLDRDYTVTSKLMSAGLSATSDSAGLLTSAAPGALMAGSNALDWIGGVIEAAADLMENWFAPEISFRHSDNTVNYESGDIVLNLGRGHDTLDFTASDGAMHVVVKDGHVRGLGADHSGSINIRGINTLLGSGHDDSIYLNGTRAEVDAGAGNDTVHMRSGASQKASGGVGRDTLAYEGSHDIRVDITASDDEGFDATLVYGGHGHKNRYGKWTSEAEGFEVYRGSDARETIKVRDLVSGKFDGGAGYDAFDAHSLAAELGGAQVDAGGLTFASGEKIDIAGFERLVTTKGADTIHTEGLSRVHAGNGNDTIFLSGATRLDAGNGNDRIMVAADDASVRVSGGNGYDILDFSGMEDRAKIRAWNTDYYRDKYDGREAFDVYLDEGGKHTVSGVEEIIGTDWNDSIYVSQGRIVHGNDGDDRLVGNKAIRWSYGSSWKDAFHGGDGDDYLDGNSGNDRLFGEAGNDTLYGGAYKDMLDGGSGNDRLYGEEHNDTLHGGAGDDSLWGGSNNDKLYGGDGDDHLNGGWHSDRMYGGNGNDVFHGSKGDIMVGGAGNDHFNIGGDTRDYGATVDFSHSDMSVSVSGNQIRSGDGTDTFSGKLSINGGSANDDLRGVRVAGKDGDDTLHAVGYNTYAYGGAGDDRIYLHGKWEHRAYGGSGDDWIYGDKGNSRYKGSLIDGGAGNDFLRAQHTDEDRVKGGAGADFLQAMTWKSYDFWADSLTGGGGRDVFYVRHGATIEDFNPDEDVLVIDPGALVGRRLPDIRDHGSQMKIDVVGDSYYGDIRIKGLDASDAASDLDIRLGSYSDAYDVWTSQKNLTEQQSFDHVEEGTSADERLVSSAGDDWMKGGGGTDEFHFREDFGNDKIVDFSIDDTARIAAASEDDIAFEDLGSGWVRISTSEGSVELQDHDLASNLTAQWIGAQQAAREARISFDAEADEFVIQSATDYGSDLMM